MGQRLNWDSINAFISVLSVAMCPNARNSLLALLQIEEICWSKLSSESMKIPSKVSFMLVLIEASPIYILVRVLELKSK